MVAGAQLRCPSIAPIYDTESTSSWSYRREPEPPKQNIDPKIRLQNLPQHIGDLEEMIRKLDRENENLDRDRRLAEAAGVSHVVVGNRVSPSANPVLKPPKVWEQSVTQRYPKAGGVIAARVPAIATWSGRPVTF
jgi:hypothetical protein